MADNNNTDEFRLDLDSKEFIQQALDAHAAIIKLGTGEELTGLVEGLLSAGAAVGAIGAAIYVWKAGFEAILDAEKLRMVGAQFDDLTKKAGLFGGDLIEQLKESSKGWVEETELMKHADKALLELQVGFEKLPEIMSIAKDRTNVYGGTVLENFDKINNAVATGTTRQLRHLGIIIDQEKAYRDYASSIGATVDTLSLAGKQQAVLNAVLDDQKKKMFDSHEELLKYTSEWERFKTNVSELKEAFILFFHDAIVPVGEGLAKIVNSYFALVKFNNDLGVAIGGAFRKYVLGIEEAKQGLGDLMQAERKHDQSIAETAKASTVDLEKQKKQRAEVAKDMAELDSELVKEQMKNLTTIEEGTAAYHAHLAQEGAKVQAQIDQVRAKQSQGLLTAAQADQEIVKLNALKNAKMKVDDAALWKEQQKALDNYVKHSQGAFDAVGRSFKKASLEAQHDIQTGMKFGDTAVKSFSKNATSNMEAWGAGTKSATEAIGGMFAGMAGDMASQYGEMMMLAAIWPPNPPAFAAGVALVALGGYLKSLGGSSGSSASAPSGGGGESPSTAPAANAGVQGPTSAAANTAQQHKSVTLQIQGHMFMNDQTQRWLVDQIRAAADATDFKIQSVGGGL